ncbi:UDP-galactose 4-epimerase [Jatrophihabitans endophyticus]|uniref:UDP-glucose 4-epimerase n=1 Tax=Jatrophihabitans endophyticus TaxID=1206085 RepID=A0A1M5U6X1_9ACTN|nr:UDP-glucose 4-epimerase GalE [Jatrophihabitans endophyticus]SHH58699.1 UDP-galactose 4-epimerase [Jatrophihabitans endophyticus]
MRVLVTGGAGYIGSVVAARLIADGHEVVVVDDLSTGHADAVPPGAVFHEMSVAALDPVLGDWDIEAVVHFAAKSLVGESTTLPSAYWRNNVVGTIALLDSMRAHGVGRIVFSSSAATYGQQGDEPIREDAPARPSSPYGATKLAIDLALTDYARAYGLAATSLRYFNVAGAFETSDAGFYGERHDTETHLIPNALAAVAGSGGSLKLFGTDYPTPDGTCVRDYIHVIDLADAHVRALSAGEPGEHHVVNLGSGSGSSVREVLDAVERVTGTPVPVEEGPRRAGDPPVLVASNQKAADLLGWHPVLDLTTMVDDAWRFRNDRAGEPAEDGSDDLS